MGTDSEDYLYLSRNEQLHLLFDAHVVNDEEDTLLSSILQSEKEYFPGSLSLEVLLPIGTILGEELASSLLCGFALAFDRHAKSFTLNF